MEPFASLAALPRSGVPRLLLNRELVGPFRSRRRKQEDFALTGDLVTSVKEIGQLAGWLEELEKLSSTSSTDDPSSNSHGTASSIGHDDSLHSSYLQTSDEEGTSTPGCSYSPNLSYKSVHSHSYTSPLKQPQVKLSKLKDSPELQRSLRKLNKQTEARLKTKEITSNEEDVTLCTSMSNMSIT